MATHEVRLPTPNPKRITMALNLRGMYGPEVDAALGVMEPTVDMWETGAIVPTAGQVRRLAMLTRFPAKFFYRPTRDLDLQLLCWAAAPCCCSCHATAPEQGVLL